MADSTATNFAKMKVTELRKELKARGLASTGDKSELVERLQQAAAAAHDDYTLDSDEIDSEGVLEDEEDDKTAADISLDDAHPHDSFHDELAELDEKPKEPERKAKTLKRKLIVAPDDEKKEKQNGDGKESGGKKIILHRPVSIPASEPKAEEPTTPTEAVADAKTVAIKAAPPLEDSSAKLESRAKRFGLPMSEAEKKEARKIRFGQTSAAGATAKVAETDSNIEKLRKRAERFGQSVSKTMEKVEAEERLQKRRSKFGLVK